MRTHTLSRAVVAIASLAVGAAALAAVPATAATSTGVTRDAVLTAATILRGGVDSQEEYTASQRALRSIASRSCKIDTDGGESLLFVDGTAVQTPGSADGVLVSGFIVNFVESETRTCYVGATAAVSPGFTLKGSAKVTVTTEPDDEVVLQAAPSVNSPLSRDVAVTAPINVPGNDNAAATFTATGAASKIVATKVATPKTAKQKKAAKARYSKALKSAKKSYKKALDKAGDSKSKKAKAKKAYDKKKRAAKAKYKKAIATSKIVKKTDNRPFSLTATRTGGGGIPLG